MAIITAKRFTRAEYHRLAELGFLSEDDRFELIEGEIIQMAAKGTPHSTVSRRLLRELSNLVGNQATLQSQEPVVLLTDSEPEPDLAIVQNRADDYLDAHPTSVDVLLVIEIADSSLSSLKEAAGGGSSGPLSYDQSTKLALYAEAGISDYWIFNLVENCLESYSEPYQNRQGNFGYRRKLIFLPNESANLPGFPNLSLDLSKAFPGITLEPTD